MSLSALKYDNCEYTHKLRETISPGDYMIGTPRPCNPCFVSAPGVPLGGFGASLCEKDIIDVNSELLNITRKASDCPSKKYLPQAEPMCKATNYQECSFLTPEDTLISNPKCTGREATVNRWEWLCKQPQDHALVPFPWFVPNRIVVKDNHRPCIPKPVDQSAALPPKVQEKCKDVLDEQFKEGDWKNTSCQFQQENKFGSVFLATCQKVSRM
jgi:hypothetical protein